MIEMYTARTSEIDEIEVAIEELKSQIDFQKLKKNSGGLLYCSLDFVESGVAKAVCDIMPFDVIGMTTLASADEHGYGIYELTLTILTSDEVSFTAGLSGSIKPDTYHQEIELLFSELRGKVSEDPALILSFIPHMRDVAGYEIVDAMDSVCGGIPIWGSITTSVDFTYGTVSTIYNGEILRSGLAMMFINGPVEPHFIICSIPERNVTNSRGIVTKSNGSILYEVSDMPIMDYLKSIGLEVDSENITTVPLLLYYDNADEYVALGFYTLFEDGSVLTGGPMPENTPFVVGYIDEAGIHESANIGFDRILALTDRQATLLLPCITRYIMLAPNQEDELKLICKRLTVPGKPFAMAYSGGEICPMLGADGKLHNRFHNYSFSACVLSSADHA